MERSHGPPTVAGNPRTFSTVHSGGLSHRSRKSFNSFAAAAKGCRLCCDFSFRPRPLVLDRPARVRTLTWASSTLRKHAILTNRPFKDCRKAAPKDCPRPRAVRHIRSETEPRERHVLLSRNCDIVRDYPDDCYDRHRMRPVVS